MTENVNTSKYDKSNWQKGLGWENEPDRVDFITNETKQLAEQLAKLK